MNIEARKIEFIQEFLKLQNEEAISKLEEILRKEKRYADDRKSEPMSVREFNERIDKSMEDSKNGKLTEANDLLGEIELEIFWTDSAKAELKKNFKYLKENASPRIAKNENRKIVLETLRLEKQPSRLKY